MTTSNFSEVSLEIQLWWRLPVYSRRARLIEGPEPKLGIPVGASLVTRSVVTDHSRVGGAASTRHPSEVSLQLKFWWGLLMFLRPVTGDDAACGGDLARGGAVGGGAGLACERRREAILALTLTPCRTARRCSTQQCRVRRTCTARWVGLLEACEVVSRATIPTCAPAVLSLCLEHLQRRKRTVEDPDLVNQPVEECLAAVL